MLTLRARKMLRRPWLLATAVAAALVMIGAAVVAPSRPGVAGASAVPLSVSVKGNHLVNGSGQVVRLLGVDRSGTEYMCASGSGIFDGPSNAASVQAMAAWHINAVRIPLNEDCWLNHAAALDPDNPADTGANYQNAIVNYVKLLNSYGIYAILDLHWNGCGSSSCLANWQKEMPDRPYADNFWSSVASKFKSNHAVLFDLFNEPYGVSWSCWRNGGCTAYAGSSSNQYTVAGMQEMLNAVRKAGATQPVMVGGLSYANDMSGWLANLPSDPDHQMVASVHLYNFNSPCSTTACLSTGPYSIMPLAAKYPVVFGEIGENDCADGFIDSVMSWADQHGFSYLGWAWDPYSCSGFPALITNYNGTPTAFGVGLQQHLDQLAASGGSAPATSRRPQPATSGGTSTSRR